jgi:tRNA nucleotidyltransferase (CCA-adding enzyme)
MLSALCHDFGKAVSTKKIDGVIRALGHETEGLPWVEKFLKRITTDKKLIRYVLNMTMLHMRPNMLYAQKSGVKATNKLFDEAISPDDLIQLSLCDNRGKIPCEAGENTEILHNIIYFGLPAVLESVSSGSFRKRRSKHEGSL